MRARPIAAVMLCAGSLALAAAPRQTPVFHGGTVLVPLNVTVLDKDGHAVPGLTAADFTVLEDGVPRPIRSFLADRLEASTAPPPASQGSLLRSAPVDPGAGRARRTFLLMLGFGRIQTPARALDGALHFVNDDLLPQDLVAIVGFNRATDFTTDHAAVAGVIERFKRDYERVLRDIEVFYTGPFHRLDDFPPEIQTEIDAIFAPYRRSTVDLYFSRPGFQRFVSRERLPWNHMLATDETRKFNACMAYLDTVRGERHLVVMTSRGVPQSTVQADQRLAAMANAARVTIDIISTGGVPPPLSTSAIMAGIASTHSGSPVPPPLIAADAAFIASNERVAQLSGGQFSGVTMAAQMLDRIDAATRFEYLLGYEPGDAKLDSRMRHLEIKLARPGLTAIFAHSYTPEPPDPGEAARRESVTSARLAVAASLDVPHLDIGVKAAVSELPHVGLLRRYSIELTIDPTHLSFVHAGLYYRASLDIRVVAGDDAQQVVGDQTAVDELELTETQYQRALKDGVKYVVRLPVTGVARYVRAAVYDYDADLLGTATVTIK